MPKRYFLVPLIGLFFMGKSIFRVYSYRSELGDRHTLAMHDSIVTVKLQRILKRYGEIDKPGFVFMVKYDSSACYQGSIGVASRYPVKN
ncbi:hypothetical protein M2408_000584 [Sphingobacterium sp. BIGb0165]|nr:hypothetical protein [Sphingobacterium sp. BIGb0165]